MAKDKARPANKLPSIVPGPSAAPPARKRKVSFKTPPAAAHTIVSDPIGDGLAADYDWDDPSLVEEPETSVSPLAQPESHSPPTPGGKSPAANSPASSPPPTHSSLTLHLAKQLGMSDERIAKYQPADLDAFVQDLHDHREQLRREHVINQTTRNPVPPQGGTAPTVAEKPGTAPPAEEALSWGVDEDGKPIDEKDIHPGLVGVIKHLHQQIKDLKEATGGLMLAEQSRGVQTQAQKLDALFAKNAAQFGDGSVETVQKSDPAKYQKRLALLTVMKALQSGSMDERFEEAHKIIYGDLPTATPASPATPARDPKTGQFAIHDDEEVDRWEKAGTELPTNRMPAAAPKGEKKAIESVKQLLRDNPDIIPDQDYSGEFLSANGQL